MFTSNPFAELSASISPAIMQTYVVIMVLLVVGGTLFDVVHKKSAKYFFANWRKAQDKGSKQVGSSEIVGLAVQTAIVEVATSAEFCNARRRLAHLLTMYGFIAYVLATVAMVFCYETSAATPAIWPTLWTLGALAVCGGGYWFWFFIRVDVAAEGNSPFRIIRADMFILSLLASTTLGLIWAFLQAVGADGGATVFLWLYVLATTYLFGSIPWSKFSHMFFKPAAALQKRVETSNGTRSNLPAPADKPETLGSATTLPRHY